MALGPAARFDAWRIIGPGGGGAQFVPAISPHDPARVLVACDMTGSYLSDDAGASWRMFNLRDRARFFVFDPKDPNVIYAGTSDLWRTTDGGKSWRLVHPAPAKINGAVMPGDHAEFELRADDPPNGSVTALAIDSENTKSLYAAFRDGRSNALWRSNDAGATWKKMADLNGEARNVALSNGSVWAVGAEFVASCGPEQCTSSKTPVRFIDACAGVEPDGRVVVYGISRDAIYVQRDSGSAWEKSQLPGQGAEFRAAATSAHHGEVAYVSYEKLNDGGKTWFGVAKTTDTGRTWQLEWKENSTPTENVHDVWLSARFGPSWSGSPLSLGVSPTDPNIVYGGDFGRTMRSTDGGRTWTGVYSIATPQQTFTTNGMDVTTAYGVHFDPFDRKRMFISYTDIGLFKSEDGGASWSSATANGVPRRWVNTTYWIVFDPQVRGRAWAVMSGTHDLPRPKMWRRTSVQRYQGGVVASDDGGNSWHVSSDGMQPSAATHILLDARSPAGSRVLYVAAFGRGVYKSSDGGKSWSLKNDGLPGPEPFAWRLAQDSKGVLYVVLARRSEDGSYGGSGDGALYRSTDGASHWTRVMLPDGVNGPNGLAIDARDDRRLYLATWGRQTHNGAAGGGIWMSVDAGATWRNVLSRDQHVYDVTSDPRNADVLYACGFESSAWRSSDRGMTWTRIRGFNFKWGHRVIPDPFDPARVYITTFGGSVWHGPALGDPRAPEDIATPELAYTR